MTSIDFTHASTAHRLAPDEVFASPPQHGFTDTSTTDMRSIIAQVERGMPWQDVVGSRFAETQPWLTKIIQSPQRTAFFEELIPKTPGLTLDIGAGWGQMSRPLAAAGWRVAALEPGRERLDFIRASARQDGLEERISYLNTDYLDVTFQSRFDVCLCIGVFEWIGAFQDHEDPLARQRQFLRKVRSELAPGGALIMGIENRLGLKYLLGCPDDHIGQPGIACLPAELATRRWREESGHTLRSFVYTDAELTALLHEAGFTDLQFWAALPDYKLTERLVSLQDDGRSFNAGMLAGTLFCQEHNGYDGSILPRTFQESLQGTYASLGMQGIAHHFAPSFFVRAT